MHVRVLILAPLLTEFRYSFISFLPSEIQRLDGLSMVSMNSTNATYHDTPLIHYSPDRVTVVNPHADDEVMGDLMTHDYHEPYEINGANARSRRQPPPPYSKGQVMAANQVEIPDTVANVLYGDPSALFGNYPPPPSSPTYQEPDALAVVSLHIMQVVICCLFDKFGSAKMYDIIEYYSFKSHYLMIVVVCIFVSKY